MVDASAARLVFISMAGLLAEDILSGETDDAGAMADTLFFRISFGEASASDLAQMGVTDIDSCELSYEVVEEAVRLLRQEWSLAQKESSAIQPSNGAHREEQWLRGHPRHRLCVAHHPSYPQFLLATLWITCWHAP
jgi:hypothetical protein